MRNCEFCTSGPVCEAQHQPRGFTCTRPPGHDGKHVACGNRDHDLCRWTDKPDEHTEKLHAVLTLESEIARLQQWVNDLQAGMYINCVYCGHRYGPDSEVTAAMADVLKAHIEQCPKHPMSALKRQRDELQAVLENVCATFTLGGTAQELANIALNRIHGLPESTATCDHDPDKHGRLSNKGNGDEVCLGCGEKLPLQKETRNHE